MPTRRIVSLGLVLAVACGTPGPPGTTTTAPFSTTGPGTTTAPIHSKHPAMTDTHTTPPHNTAPREQPLIPAAELVAWFEQHSAREGSRTRFKIPVVILFDEFRMAFAKSFIGTDVNAPAPGHLALELDDGGLGVSLLEQLRGKCSKNAQGCAVWLEGYWGPLVLSGPPIIRPPSADPNAHEFAVLTVGEVIATPIPAAQATLQ